MTQQNFLKSLGPNERREYLQTNAADIYEGKYAKPLTEDEVLQCKDDLSQTFLTISDLEEAFAVQKAEHKQQVKPHKEKIADLARQVRTRQMQADGFVYSLPNYEDGVMEVYNDEGEFLHSRRLTPAEKQTNVFTMQKTAN